MLNKKQINIFGFKKEAKGKCSQAVSKAFLEELRDRVDECVIVLVPKACFS